MIDYSDGWWLEEFFGSKTVNINGKRQSSTNEEDFLVMLIQTGYLDDLWLGELQPIDVLTRSGRTNKINYYTDTRWGQLYLQNPDIKDPTSKVAREFRRKFRLPYPVFDKVIVPECDRLNVFEVKDESRVRIPTDFKVLICLRILGRGSYHDDVAEMAFSFKSTCHKIFRQFLRNFTPAFYTKFVTQPTGLRRKKIMDTYAKIGLHGCMGSMDATHVFWARCPPDKHNLCIGKEKNRLLHGIA
jgi:hypothetical protein